MEIKQNVAVPDRAESSAAKTGRPAKYPFADMAVGDSVFIPGDTRSSLNARSSALKFGTRSGRRFITREEPGGIRIWRVEKEQPETRTEIGEHEGWRWSLSVTKSPAGTYTALAEISCQAHTATICFPAGGRVGVADTPVSFGSYLNENPYEFIVEFLPGFIEGRNAEVGRLLATGQSEKFKKLIKQESVNSNPRTDASKEQKQAMKEALAELVERFSPGILTHLIAEHTGKTLTTETVSGWVSRGRISATMAHAVCQIPAVRDSGFTREMLRPDVESWDIADSHKGK